jgi:uncharacterized membrane protein
MARAPALAVCNIDDVDLEYDAHVMPVNLTTIVLLSLAIGGIAGLRAMTAPAAVSWAARLQFLNLAPTGLSFLAHAVTPWILTALALAELVTDQLPSTPSRTVPIQFGTRIVTGGLSGAAIGAGSGALGIGLVCGAIGAICGTLGGRAFRAKTAAAFGSDPPAAFLEDAIAIGGAALLVAALP